MNRVLSDEFLAELDLKNLICSIKEIDLKMTLIQVTAYSHLLEELEGYPLDPKLFELCIEIMLDYVRNNRT